MLLIIRKQRYSHDENVSLFIAIFFVQFFRAFPVKIIIQAPNAPFDARNYVLLDCPILVCSLHFSPCKMKFSCHFTVGPYKITITGFCESQTPECSIIPQKIKQPNKPRDEALACSAAFSIWREGDFLLTGNILADHAVVSKHVKLAVGLYR